MQVKILQRMGRKGHHPGLRAAAHAFADQLMQGDTRRGLKLRLELRKSTLPRHTLGVAWDMPIEDDGYGVRIQRDIPYGAQLATLAHEMVHVSQMATGRLAHDGHTPVWLGKRMGRIAYMDRPWEVEARALSAELLDAHLRTLPLPTRMRATWESKVRLGAYLRPPARRKGPTILVSPVGQIDASYERWVGWFFSPVTWMVAYVLLSVIAQCHR
jgi:hypothetical protein